MASAVWSICYEAILPGYPQLSQITTSLPVGPYLVSLALQQKHGMLALAHRNLSYSYSIRDGSDIKPKSFTGYPAFEVSTARCQLVAIEDLTSEWRGTARYTTQVTTSIKVLVDTRVLA